jgi:hypothetical protein
MTRRASSRSRDVGDDRARLAVADAHPKTIVGQFGGETAVLAMPRLPAGTEEEKAAAAVIEAELARDAARCAARIVMLRGHKCGGKSCRRRSHEGDREALADLLEMLFREIGSKGTAAVRRPWR